MQQNSPDERSPWTSIVAEMKERFDLRIRKWRDNLSGCAWRVHHTSGKTVNWMESPLPRSAVSLAIFLHECGHHAIGFDRSKKRCEEEYHVWMWALDRMREFNIEPDETTLRRVEMSMQYAVDKALRRGMKDLPSELQQYLPVAA